MRLNAFLPFLVLPLGLYGACSTGDVVKAPDAGLVDVVTQDARADENEIPCEPRLVLQTICQQCHTKPMKNGAPFPLINRSDIFAPRFGSVVRLMMIEQLESGRMPLSPVTITAEDKETLLTWLKSGAPAIAPRACEPKSEDAGNDADIADAPTEAGLEGDEDAGDAGQDG
jgi:hypothetical protein